MLRLHHRIETRPAATSVVSSPAGDPRGRGRCPRLPARLPAADFERFSRPDAGRTGDGAGLGLAIAATVARAHGGDADAGNGPAGGAYVRLRIPDRA